ncbi:MAG: helix-turn-helix domain-containing protein [Solirubrobacterales bacterium]
MADTDRELRERFAANIERLRRRGGFSVEELAERSDLDARELEEILRADRETAYGTIAALAGVFGVQPEELLEGIRWVPPGEAGDGRFEVGGA